jgi:hypothetical protein
LKGEEKNVRDLSGIGGKLGAFRVFCAAAAVLVLVLTFPEAAHSMRMRSVVRYEKIERIPGFRFENLVYDWDKVALDVVNTTTDIRKFGGTMVFLDRNGRPLARAELLPRKIDGLRSERYAAFFVEGSGETARRAMRVRWDFVMI